MYDQNKIIVDKMPFNFKWIGFIKILFPHAKIIHSNRNPVDSAFSIYRNMFDSLPAADTPQYALSFMIPTTVKSDSHNMVLPIQRHMPEYSK